MTLYLPNASINRSPWQGPSSLIHKNGTAHENHLNLIIASTCVNVRIKCNGRTAIGMVVK